MRTTAAGPEGSFQADKEYDVSAELAEAFLNAEPKAAELVLGKMETADAPPPEARDEEDAGEDELPDWPLKMGPEEYLEKHPNGPKAVLARKILDS